MVREEYYFCRDDINIHIMRHYATQPDQEYADGAAPVAGPMAELPTLESIRPRCSAGGRWILYAKVYTRVGHPEELAKAQDTLMAFARELEGAITFLKLDRKVHEVRVFPEPAKQM
jgi:hypothetical protein